MGYSKQVLFFLFLGALLFLDLGMVYADEVLEEGFSVAVKSGTAARHRLEASIDLSILPLPVPGGGRFNSTRIMIGAGIDEQFSAPHIDRLQVHLLYWPHIRALGLRRERDQGLIAGFDIIGGSLPWEIAGKKESRNWIIGLVGVDLGYDWFRQHFGGTLDGRALRLRPSI